MPQNLAPNHMKANIVFKDLQINGVKVSAINDFIFSVSVPKDFSAIAIKLFADNGASINFYATFIGIIFKRKDITSYELYREED